VGSREVTWPIRSSPLPPLAGGFVARPESAPGLSEVLSAGTAVALTPSLSARTGVPAGSPDWAASVGKTQLAVYLAESLWLSRDIDLLVWVNAASRVSILSAYAAAAAAAIGIDPASDAESVSARFISWLGETRRPWLVVLDDLSAAHWGQAGKIPVAILAANCSRTGLIRRDSASYAGIHRDRESSCIKRYSEQ